MLSTDPPANGINAPRDATIQVTFTEPVDVDRPGSRCRATAPACTQASLAGAGPARIIHHPRTSTSRLANMHRHGSSRTRIHDQDTDDSGLNTDTLTADYSWSFTSPPAPRRRIRRTCT